MPGLLNALSALKRKREKAAEPVENAAEEEEDADEPESDVQVVSPGRATAQHVVPVGSILQAFKKADRDPLVSACGIYMVFLLSFCLIMTMVRPVHTTYTIQQAVWGQLATEAMDPVNIHFDKTWFDIANYGDFWVWVDSVLYGASYKCCHVNGEKYGEVGYGPNNDLRVATYNRIISPIRFRQVRTRMNGACATQTPEDNHELSRPCWDQWGMLSDTEETNARFEFSKYETGLSTFRGDPDDGYSYGYGGFIVDLPLNATKARDILDMMKSHRWTDEWTRAVAIEVNLYNPNFDMAMVIRFTVDIVSGGHFFPRAEMFSCRLNPYSNIADSLRMVVEFIFVVLLFHYLFVEFKKMRAQGFKVYIKQVGNVVELLNLSFFVYIILRWVQYVMADKEPFRKRSYTQFADLYTVALQFNSCTEISAFNVVWSFMKVFKYLKIYTRFMLIFDVILHSMGTIAPFSLVIFLILLSFCFSAYWLYGAQVYDYHTFPQAFSYLLRSMVEGFEYEPMKLAQPKAAPVWAIAWTAMSGLVLLNMFVAILCDSYAFIQDRTKKQDAMEEGYPAPSWILWIHSKLPCFKARKVEDEAQLQVMRKAGKQLRKQLKEVDRNGLWVFLLKKVGNEEYDLSAEELMKFFPGDDDERRNHAKIWMTKFSRVEGVMMKPTPIDTTSLEEIQKLRDQIVSLEAEIDELSEALDLVAPIDDEGTMNGYAEEAESEL